MPKEQTETNKGFEENFRKLEALANELQENKISIDQLVPRMKEALSAIKVCKEVLKETRSQLTEINSEFAEVREKLAEE